MYQMTFLGLVAFVDVTPKGGLVMLPNGVDFGNGVPSHFARFYIENDRIVDASDWWSPVEDDAMAQRCVTVFPINAPSELTFTGMEETLAPRTCEDGSFERENYLDASRHTTLMPTLNELDRKFKVDPQNADTIAKFTIRRATLYAHRLGKAAVSMALVHTDSGPVTITAKTRDGQKKLIVKDGTEIVLANMSPLGTPGPDEHAPGHVNIYRRLDPKSKRELKEPKEIGAQLTPLYGPSRHPLVVYIRTRFGDIPRGGCSGRIASSKPGGCKLW